MSKLLYPELSYELNGIAFHVQNKIGRFAREVQYCNLYEDRLIELQIPYVREYIVLGTGNRVDFIVRQRLRHRDLLLSMFRLPSPFHPVLMGYRAYSLWMTPLMLTSLKQVKQRV